MIKLISILSEIQVHGINNTWEIWKNIFLKDIGPDENIYNIIKNSSSEND